MDWFSKPLNNRHFFTILRGDRLSLKGLLDYLLNSASSKSSSKFSWTSRTQSIVCHFVTYQETMAGHHQISCWFQGKLTTMAEETQPKTVCILNVTVDLFQQYLLCLLSLTLIIVKSVRQLVHCKIAGMLVGQSILSKEKVNEHLNSTKTSLVISSMDVHQGYRLLTDSRIVYHSWLPTPNWPWLQGTVTTFSKTYQAAGAGR